LVNLDIKNSNPLSRQTKGLLVMLEKAPRKINVSKLCAILLLKVDFNTLYKIMFNMRILPSLECDRLILDEIIGGRHR
jgi:hypothetical protein